MMEQVKQVPLEVQIKKFKINYKKIMRLTFFKNLLLLFLLTVGYGCKDDNYIGYYGDYLGIEFPKNITEICYESIVHDFDYTNTAIYRLSDFENQKIINQINKKLCDSITIKKGDCWLKECEVYTLKISDSTFNSTYFLEATIGSFGHQNLLIIEQVKW